VTKLTPFKIEKLKKRVDRYEVSDNGTGLRVVVHPTGRKMFALRFRYNGQPRKLTFPNGITLAQARSLAADAMLQVAKGADPCAAKRAAKKKAADTAKGTFRAVCASYLQLEGKGLRTIAERERLLRNNVYPAFGSRQLDSIKRSEIVKLLDKITVEHGERTADNTLAAMRVVFNWYAIRSDVFLSPIVKGMGRYKIHENRRTRSLEDTELKAVWDATGQLGTYGALVKFLLLTGARLNEAARMEWDELSGADWTLPAARNKTKVDLLRPLSPQAMAVLAELPRFQDCPYVFTVNGRTPFTTFSRGKKELDKLSGVTGWVVHDTRRCVRSLLSRIGIPNDAAEQVLGHVLRGIRGTYDKYSFYAEKKHALEALANRIDLLTGPVTDNVAALRG
jgi:integrase